ncbi:hypothetical protein V7056_19020 [Bacillus sp. JJ664]
MNFQFAKILSENIFIERKNLFKNADVVLYHPGHFPELNEHIVKLYKEESFNKIMIPSVYNDYLKEDEYLFHKALLVNLGIPEDIILPINGEAESANDVIKNAMFYLNSTDERNILLVGKTFFVNRFLLIASTFAKNDMILDVLPLEDNRGLNRDNWHLTDIGRKRVLNEYHMISHFLKQNNQLF